MRHDRLDYRIALLLSFFLVPLFCSFQLKDPLAQKNNRANQAFEQQDYQEALKLYTDALLEAPDSPIVHYNIGNVYMKQRKYEEAVKEYAKATEASDISLQQKAYYNLGNAYFYQGKWDQAILQYKKALELAPDDMDVKYNLEYVRKKIKEQAEKQKQTTLKGRQQQAKGNQQDKQQQSNEKQKAEALQKQQKPSQGEEKQQKPPEQQTDNGGQTPTPQPQVAQAQPSDEQDENQMDIQQALQLLQNLDENEKEILKKLLMQKQGRVEVEKDW